MINSVYNIYPPTPALAMTGVAPGTTFGVDFGFPDTCLAPLQQGWPLPNQPRQLALPKPR